MACEENGMLSDEQIDKLAEILLVELEKDKSREAEREQLEEELAEFEMGVS
jgi:hypothetical protein